MRRESYATSQPFSRELVIAFADCMQMDTGQRVRHSSFSSSHMGRLLIVGSRGWFSIDESEGLRMSLVWTGVVHPNHFDSQIVARYLRRGLICASLDTALHLTSSQYGVHAPRVDEHFSLLTICRMHRTGKTLKLEKSF
jgi:hypothetical protein